MSRLAATITPDETDFPFFKTRIQKSLHWEAFRRCFPFSSHALASWIQVLSKKEVEEQHSLLALPFGTLQKTFIEKATAIKVNVLMALKRKEGD
ncbi:hypothetical protein ACLK14_09900 [Escherichia coli]